MARFVHWASRMGVNMGDVDTFGPVLLDALDSHCFDMMGLCAYNHIDLSRA